ncbi:MAG: hypothetical protein KKA60_11750 [Proteobacteria bacterium]|nr:hypothetical protein [Pseudomonadota bacterium]
MKKNHDNLSVRHWEKRPEPNWEKFSFNQPYAKGLKRLNEEVLAKTNFDPATLWQWGTMQAMALIEVLKTAEEKFGAEGQKLVLDSLKRVGYDIGRQITEGTTLPEEITASEYCSFFATICNKIAYASLETATIDSDDAASFHIDWCPHQDHYKAFDCRVQRYFVQGMIDAATDFYKAQRPGEAWEMDVAFQSIIPMGSETCFFTIEKGDPKKARAWGEFTQMIEEKALDLAAKRKAEKHQPQ